MLESCTHVDSLSDRPSTLRLFPHHLPCISLSTSTTLRLSPPHLHVPSVSHLVSGGGATAARPGVRGAGGGAAGAEEEGPERQGGTEEGHQVGTSSSC